jgi:putative transposase
VAGFIAAQRAEYGVPHALACRALGVSQAWFYKWRHGDGSPRRARRRALSALVAALFARHRGTYGAPRITADLQEMGWRVSQNTIAVIMAEQGLRARAKRRRRGTTRPGKGRWRAPDLVKRDFTARRVNQRWFGDGTEIDTAEGKLHLASVLDVCSRRIVGFALSEHHDAELAYGSLAMAVAVRGGQVGGVVLHTDQGSRVHRRNVPRGLRPAGGPPIDGPTGIGPGQRGHRIVALHPGVRAALVRRIPDQASRSPAGRGVG